MSRFGLKTIIALCALIGLFIVGAGSASAGIINTDIYTGHTAVGGGAPYTGLAGSLSTNDIMFGTNTGFNWHPFGLSDFGSDSNGFLDVAGPGIYTFTLTSDDGSLLFIDGGLVVDNGGPHGITSVSGSVALGAGIHTFEVQFFEDFGGPSGVDLTLPDGVAFSNAPEPASLITLGIGAISMLGTGWLRRRRAGQAAS